MPYSDPEGKQWSLKKIKDLKNINTILDVGAGSGTYAKLLRPILPKATLIGVEVWSKYIPMFNLTAQYDMVIRSDIRRIPDMYGLDLVIFGDILEHMTQREAIEVVKRFRGLASHVLIAIPIIEMKQGEALGNPYEEHVVPYWDHPMVMDSFDGITDFKKGNRIGCYLLSS